MLPTAKVIDTLGNLPVSVTQKRKPARFSPSIADAEVAIRKHRALTPAARELGVSRGSLDRQVSRSSRLSWLVHQMRLEIVDVAELQFAKKVQAGDTTCILRALSSPIARSRGWGVQATELSTGDKPRVNNFRITFVTPESVRAERAGRTIEHEPVEDTRAEDDVTVIDPDVGIEDDD